MTKQMRIQLVLVLLVALVGCGANSFTSSTPTKTVASTPLVEQPDGFHIEFPETPEPWQTQYESPVFGKITVHHLSVTHDDTLYSVAWHDFPNVLTDAGRLAELGTDWRETSELGGLPAMGRAVRRGPVTLVERMLLHGRRFYSVQVGGPQDPSDMTETKNCFDSFQLESPDESEAPSSP